MRIAIDARELCGRPTGVGRYLERLFDAWNDIQDAAAHRFELYVPAADEANVRARPVGRLAISVRGVAGRAGTRWEQVGLAGALRRDRPDVLFAPAYSAPLAVTVPTVLALHDLSFVAHPEWFPPVQRVRRRAISVLAARRARLVVTISEFSAMEVTRLLKVPRERIRVTPLGVGTRDARAETGSRTGHDAPGGAVVLFVGSIFNRRHLPELIRAFAVVARRHAGARLEIVGDNRTYPPQDLEAVAAAEGVGDATAIRSYVSDETLASLYAEAGAFVFLSDYEGFGLTPLEALAAGVPVIVGDTAVAREVYGDAARFVGTTDVAAVADALESLLFDPGARRAFLDRAPAVIGRYSWDRAARQTLDALCEAGRG
jgi:glycosyltransferase involved in cell wall biosynthesis